MRDKFYISKKLKIQNSNKLFISLINYSNFKESWEEKDEETRSLQNIKYLQQYTPWIPSIDDKSCGYQLIILFHPQP